MSSHQNNEGGGKKKLSVDEDATDERKLTSESVIQSMGEEGSILISASEKTNNYGASKSVHLSEQEKSNRSNSFRSLDQDDTKTDVSQISQCKIAIKQATVKKKSYDLKSDMVEELIEDIKREKPVEVERMQEIHSGSASVVSEQIAVGETSDELKSTEKQTQEKPFHKVHKRDHSVVIVKKVDDNQLLQAFRKDETTEAEKAISSIDKNQDILLVSNTNNSEQSESIREKLPNIAKQAKLSKDKSHGLYVSSSEEVEESQNKSHPKVFEKKASRNDMIDSLEEIQESQQLAIQKVSDSFDEAPLRLHEANQFYEDERMNTVAKEVNYDLIDQSDTVSADAWENHNAQKATKSQNLSEPCNIQQADEETATKSFQSCKVETEKVNVKNEQLSSISVSNQVEEQSIEIIGKELHDKADSLDLDFEPNSYDELNITYTKCNENVKKLSEEPFEESKGKVQSFERKSPISIETTTEEDFATGFQKNKVDPNQANFDTIKTKKVQISQVIEGDNIKELKTCDSDQKKIKPSLETKEGLKVQKERNEESISTLENDNINTQSANITFIDDEETKQVLISKAESESRPSPLVSEKPLPDKANVSASKRDDVEIISAEDVIEESKEMPKKTVGIDKGKKPKALEEKASLSIEAVKGNDTKMELRKSSATVKKLSLDSMANDSISVSEDPTRNTLENLKVISAVSENIHISRESADFLEIEKNDFAENSTKEVPDIKPLDREALSAITPDALSEKIAQTDGPIKIFLADNEASSSSKIIHENESVKSENLKVKNIDKKSAKTLKSKKSIPEDVLEECEKEALIPTDSSDRSNTAAQFAQEHIKEIRGDDKQEEKVTEVQEVEKKKTFKQVKSKKIPTDADSNASQKNLKGRIENQCETEQKSEIENDEIKETFDIENEKKSKRMKKISVDKSNASDNENLSHKHISGKIDQEVQSIIVEQISKEDSNDNNEKNLAEEEKDQGYMKVEKKKNGKVLAENESKMLESTSIKKQEESLEKNNTESVYSETKSQARNEKRMEENSENKKNIVKQERKKFAQDNTVTTTDNVFEKTDVKHQLDEDVSDQQRQEDESVEALDESTSKSHIKSKTKRSKTKDDSKSCESKNTIKVSTSKMSGIDTDDVPSKIIESNKEEIHGKQNLLKSNKKMLTKKTTKSIEGNVKQFDTNSQIDDASEKSGVTQSMEVDIGEKMNYEKKHNMKEKFHNKEEIKTQENIPVDVSSTPENASLIRANSTKQNVQKLEKGQMQVKVYNTATCT